MVKRRARRPRRGDDVMFWAMDYVEHVIGQVQRALLVSRVGRSVPF